jgi:prevent-host-death family protein
MYTIVYIIFEANMAEQFTSITNARKTLPVLSQSAQGGDERYIITNQGKPQAVLIGYGEYQGIMAAT